MITPICPICGHELIEDESYDLFLTFPSVRNMSLVIVKNVEKNIGG